MAIALLLAAQCPIVAQAATILVSSTTSNRGTFTELQCLPPGSDVDAGPTQTTVTGGATLSAAMADGSVTLREAICVANNTPEADVITLQPVTYTLSTPDNYWYGPNGLPPIGDNITIEGNGAVILRNPANTDALSQRFRFFFVSRKTLTDGIAIVSGADRARLTLRDLVLRGGLAQGGQSMAGGGGGGMGGAIFNQGELDLQRVTLDGNTARGGASGTTLPLQILTSFVWSGLGGGMGANGPLPSLPAGEGSGFGPGLFGGGLGGASLVGGTDSACGGGAGFGVGAGGNASASGLEIIGGDGGGLGNVGGSAVLFAENSGVGRDGGGGAGLSFGVLAAPNSAHGDGRGGAFGQRGNPATTCGGGGGVGSAGGVYRLESEGGMGGHGGFGGGGSGVVLVGPSLPPRSSVYLGGSGGFGGGGAASEFGAGIGGFGGGSGSAFGVGPTSTPSGGGGAGFGGALFNHGGEVTASNTTWTANQALGGAIGSAELGVFSNSRSGWGMGGAIFNLDGSLTLIQSTLAGNRASAGVAALGAATGEAAGGALYHRVQKPDVYGFAPQVSIRGSILADSVDAGGSPISDCNHSAHPNSTVGSALNEASFSIFETLSGLPVGAGSGETSTPACTMTTASTLAEPQLLPLANNGGLTPTMAIPSSSPARDAAGACTLPTDQRGLARPQGSACDAGSFELDLSEGIFGDGFE